MRGVGGVLGLFVMWYIEDKVYLVYALIINFWFLDKVCRRERDFKVFEEERRSLKVLFSKEKGLGRCRWEGYFR